LFVDRGAQQRKKTMTNDKVKEQLQKEIDTVNSELARVKSENSVGGDWPTLTKEYKIKTWVLVVN
jgi:hypothetical protein